MRIPRIAGCLLDGVTIAAASGVAGQDNYPNRVLRIVTSEPESTNDMVACMVARGITPALGQQTIVENRGGISFQHIVRSAPDGYNILFFGSPAWITLLFRKLPYDPLRDLAAITTGCWQPTVLVVHPSLPIKSVKELVALARARPGDINFGVGATIAAPTPIRRGDLSGLRRLRASSFSPLVLTDAPWICLPVKHSLTSHRISTNC